MSTYKETLCKVETCTNLVKHKGWCMSHYRRWYTYGNPEHKLTWELRGPICQLEDCDDPHDALGYCRMHYKRYKAHGDPYITLTPGRGSKRTERPDGYVEIFIGKGEPGAQANGWIKEHRKVMQEKLNRPLLDSENVHHINGVRNDNRPENLELWSKSQPAGQRVEDKLAWAQEMIRLYGETA